MALLTDLFKLLQSGDNAVNQFLGIGPTASEGEQIVSPLPKTPEPPASLDPTTMKPGEEDWLKQQKAREPNTSFGELARRYQQATTSPGGIYYQSSVPTPTPQVLGIQSNTNVDPQVDSFLTQHVFPVTRKYNIPDQVAAGQFAAEGRLKSPGASKNNYYNIGALDSNPAGAPAFATPEQGVEAYAKFVTGQGTYPSQDHQQTFQQAAQAKSPDAMLSIINQRYAGDPTTYAQRAHNGFSSYADLVRSTPEWNKYAQ